MRNHNSNNRATDRTPFDNVLPRSGCKDIWNAWMLDENTEWDVWDIPFCRSTANSVPAELVSYQNAAHAHKKLLRKYGVDYRMNAFLHGWEDDYKYDSRSNSIWLYPERFWTVAKHYVGFITPDFSACLDFPIEFKFSNTYRMRTMGYWMNTQGMEVINNVRWSSAETYSLDFAGIPKHSMVAIGSVASGLKERINMPEFECGLREMVSRIEPPAVIVYGSVNYPVFDELRQRGIKVVEYPSRTNLAFKKKAFS